MKKMETQRQSVKKWLESGRTITAHEAYLLCGTMRLSAIIHHLKNEKGMYIVSERIYTDQTNFSKYWLTSDPKLKEEIKAYLMRGNYITTTIAEQVFECDNLSLILKELKDEGLNIVEKTKKPLCGEEFNLWVIK